MTSGPVREAVDGLQDQSALRSAVDELQISGFDRSDVSFVAGRRWIERKSGAVYDGCESRTDAKAAVVGGVSYDPIFMNRIACMAHEKAGSFEFMPAALSGKGA